MSTLAKVEGRVYSYDELLSITNEWEFNRARWNSDDFDGVEDIEFINTSDTNDDGYVAVTYY